MTGGRIGYYVKEERATERLYGALRDIKKRLQAGDTFCRKGVKADAGKIVLRDVLPAYGISTRWSGFIASFDYTQKLSPEVVAVARHRWQTEEEIRWALRHPEAAALRVGEREVKAPKEAPKAKPVEPRKRATKDELAPVVVPDIRLHDFTFTDKMKALRLTWQVGVDKSCTTLHALEPQTYTYERVPDERGTFHEIRHCTGGDFRTGKLTGTATRRILSEARAELGRRLPGLLQETLKESEIKFKYLMR